MKKRLGFVSNSSSSSFIIMFDKEPESVEEIKEMLFDFDSVSYYDYTISSEQASEIIFRDIEKIEEKVLREEFDNMIYEIKYGTEQWLIDRNDSDLKDFISLDEKHWKNWEEWKELSEKIELLREKVIDKMNKKFALESEGKFVYHVVFSDNDGDIYCTLEHGEVFRKVKHIRINNH